MHTASENLLQDQNKLNSTSEEIRKRLKYFNQVESISQRLQNPTFSVATDTFAEILNTIDDCLDFLRSKVNTIYSRYLWDILFNPFLAQIQRFSYIYNEIQEQFG